MDKIHQALKATETMDGIEISGNNYKVSQFLSLREHLIYLIEKQEQKPVVDEQKKRWAEEIMDSENYCRGEGYKCPFLCEGSRPGQRGELNHSESCPVSEAKQYLKELDKS